MPMKVLTKKSTRMCVCVCVGAGGGGCVWVVWDITILQNYYPTGAWWRVTGLVTGAESKFVRILHQSEKILIHVSELASSSFEVPLWSYWTCQRRKLSFKECWLMSYLHSKSIRLQEGPATSHVMFGNVLGAPQRSPSPLRCSFTYFSWVFRRGKSNVAEAMDHI